MTATPWLALCLVTATACQLDDAPEVDEAEAALVAVGPADIGGTVFREVGEPAYFSVRKFDAYSWEIDVAGDPTSQVVCPGSNTLNPACFVTRLNLAGTGMSVTQQSHVLSRIAGNGSEGSTAVVMGGTLVQVRDRRGGSTSSWTEFRATSVYLAPTVRPHGNRFLRAYLRDGGQVFDGTRTFQLPIPVTIQWSYPPGEAPPALPLVDHIVTATALSTSPDASGRIPAAVTQVFSRYP